MAGIHRNIFIIIKTLWPQFAFTVSMCASVTIMARLTQIVETLSIITFISKVHDVGRFLLFFHGEDEPLLNGSLLMNLIVRTRLIIGGVIKPYLWLTK